MKIDLTDFKRLPFVESLQTLSDLRKRELVRLQVEFAVG
jgi:hypothetical protein